MATFALKLSHNQQHAVIVLWWAKRCNANQIHSDMHPEYGNKCFVFL